MSRLLLLLLLSCSSFSQLAAQQSGELTPGTRVRIRTLQGAKVVGGIQSVSQDTLFLMLPKEAARLAIPRSAVSRIDVSRGERSRAKNALRWGLWAFAGGGTLFGTLCATDGACRDPARPDHTASQAGLELGLFMGVGTAFWGAVFGSIFPGEQWVEAPTRARVGVVPASGGRVALQVTF